MSSTSGEFVASELLHPAQAPDLVNALPFLQEDLYNAAQPGGWRWPTGIHIHLERR